MCLPTLIAPMLGASLTGGAGMAANVMFGMQALSIASGYQGAKQQADATYDYNVRKQNAQLAANVSASTRNYQRLQNLQDSLGLKTAAEIMQSTSGYRKSVATAAVSAAGAGVGGGSTLADIKQEFAQKQAEFISQKVSQLDYDTYDTLLRMEDVAAQQKAATEGTIFRPVAQPSPIAAFAQIASSGVDAVENFGTFSELGD